MSRSLYEALVNKTMGSTQNYTEFLQNSGHFAFCAVPAPHDKTLLEIMGIKDDPVKK